MWLYKRFCTKWKKLFGQVSWKHQPFGSTCSRAWPAPKFGISVSYASFAEQILHDTTFFIDISSTISCNSWLLVETSIIRQGYSKSKCCNCVSQKITCSAIFCYALDSLLCQNLNSFLLHDRELHNNNITGEIPNVLGNLTNLLSLDLYSNKITGQIPEELGNLKKLQSLYDLLSFSHILISKTYSIKFHFCFFFFSIHKMVAHYASTIPFQFQHILYYALSYCPKRSIILLNHMKYMFV